MWIEQTVVVRYYVEKELLESIFELQTAFVAFAMPVIESPISMDRYYYLYKNRKKIKEIKNLIFTFSLYTCTN